MENINWETVELTIENNIANIVMNRPQALNALDNQITNDLTNAFERCLQDDVRVITLTGRGKAFSSGGDIKLMTQLDSKPKALGELLENLHKLIIKIRNMDKPVIASINGFAFGAGFSLALACDFRIAAKNSTYSCAFVNIGLVPDSGASFFLTKLLGVAKATELMMLGDTYNSEQIWAMGLLNRLVNDDELNIVTKNYALSLADKPARSISMIKRMVNKAIISDLPDQLSLEAMLQLEAVKTPDFREGITAFVEKRSAKFNQK